MNMNFLLIIKQPYILRTRSFLSVRLLAFSGMNRIFYDDFRVLPKKKEHGFLRVPVRL